MIVIHLYDKNCVKVEDKLVEPARIVEASCIIVAGRYYMYSSQAGNFYTEARFVEINPPVTLE